MHDVIKRHDLPAGESVIMRAMQFAKTPVTINYYSSSRHRCMRYPYIVWLGNMVHFLSHVPQPDGGA